MEQENIYTFTLVLPNGVERYIKEMRLASDYAMLDVMKGMAASAGLEHESFKIEAVRMFNGQVFSIAENKLKPRKL